MTSICIYKYFVFLALLLIYFYICLVVMHNYLIILHLLHFLSFCFYNNMYIHLYN